MLFPAAPHDHPRTCLELEAPSEGMPRVLWAGCAPAGGVESSGRPAAPYGPGMPLLGEHSHELFTRPHLRGHRLGPDGAAGRDWTTRFVVHDIATTDTTLGISVSDADAGLALSLEFESLPGGALRGRAAVTNTAPGGYVVDGLEVVLPVADDVVEVLDLTGRHERERSPQRHELTDGLWLREGRGGRPGLDAASMVAVGTPGFTFTQGRVFAVHVGWSGNSVLRVERSAATGTTVGGGEHLLPGEVVLAQGETYTSPWVFFAAAENGLDSVAAAWHTWQRSLPAHPGPQPVLLNVWEAVYFDHDLARLRAIADRAASVGVELFVLDDGWFGHRRDDTAGLGDWWVDETVWPDGLGPLIEYVRSLGMKFGLWFEPEMVNPDSDLYREHPDWILSAGPHRTPIEHRNQQVLDLTRSEVFDHIFERVSGILHAVPVDFVKWDHNRDLLEAGGGARGGAPAARDQARAHHRLLAALAEAHPTVTWESCASGGGRIDFSVLERVQRFWTSDMTDALARQQIQRWSCQLVAPEYLGAHVSSTSSHSTGRTLSLDFRCATALFGSFGIEWDLTAASDQDLAVLTDWVRRYRRLRGMLQSGRTVRPDSSDPAVLLHGVVAADQSEALVAHVQLDESTHNRGVSVRVPGLARDARYRLAWEGPVELRAVSKSAPLPEPGPTGGVEVSGAVLGDRGFWMPRRRPETVTLVHLTRCP